jgi:hypothetical protein
MAATLVGQSYPVAATLTARLVRRSLRFRGARNDTLLGTHRISQRHDERRRTFEIVLDSRSSDWPRYPHLKLHKRTRRHMARLSCRICGTPSAPLACPRRSWRLSRVLLSQ